MGFINCEDNEIKIKDLPPRLFGPTSTFAKPIPRTNEELLLMKRKLKDEVVSELERLFIKSALERNDFNVTKAAKDVGMQRQNFSALVAKYKLGKEMNRKFIPIDYFNFGFLARKLLYYWWR